MTAWLEAQASRRGTRQQLMLALRALHACGKPASQEDSNRLLSERGYLEVKLSHAQGLAAAERGLSLYARLRLGQLSHSSKMVKHAERPKWRESFRFLDLQLRDVVSTPLQVSLLTKRSLGYDREVGSASVSLKALETEDFVSLSPRSPNP